MESRQSLFLVFIILAIVYGVLDFFAVLRTAKLQKFTSEWRHAKNFYLLMILQATFRIAGFVVILIYLSERHDYLTFLMISVPDSLFILNFLMIFWQMISVFRYAHFDHNLEQTLVSALSKNASQSKASLAFLCMIILWTLVQLSLFLAVGLSNVPSTSVYIETGLMNVLLSLLTFFTYCFLQRKYSGSPVKSQAWRKRLKRMNYTAVIWALCRIFRGIVDVLSGVTGLKMNGDFTEILTVLVLVGCLILSEIVCYFLVLDYAFIGIFVLTEQEVESQRASGLMMDSPTLTVNGSEANRSRRFTVVSDNFKLNARDITLTGESEYVKGKLGKVQSGIFRDHNIAYRTIPFPRVSGYMMEEFLMEIETLKALEIPHLVPLYGAIMELPIINVVCPWIEGGSLYVHLHGMKKGRLSIVEKYRIALDVALCLENLHGLGRYHGHLTSYNVLLDTELAAYVSDVGMHNMKKYAGITIGYTNKTGWTSPDLLREHFATVMKITASDDAYTMGMLLWEMLTEVVPFENLTKSEIHRQVVELDLRPVIPVHIPDRISKLIMACWASDSSRRPTLNTISKVITEEIASFST